MTLFRFFLLFNQYLFGNIRYNNGETCHKVGEFL